MSRRLPIEIYKKRPMTASLLLKSNYFNEKPASKKHNA